MKNKKFISKIFSVLCVFSVLCSVFLFSVSADSYVSSDSITNDYNYIGTPFDVALYGLTSNSEGNAYSDVALRLNDYSALTYVLGENYEGSGNKFLLDYWNTGINSIITTKWVRNVLSGFSSSNPTQFYSVPLDYTVTSEVLGLARRNAYLQYPDPSADSSSYASFLQLWEDSLIGSPLGSHQTDVCSVPVFKYDDIIDIDNLLVGSSVLPDSLSLSFLTYNPSSVGAENYRFRYSYSFDMITADSTTGLVSSNRYSSNGYFLGDTVYVNDLQFGDYNDSFSLRSLSEVYRRVYGLEVTTAHINLNALYESFIVPATDYIQSTDFYIKNFEFYVSPVSVKADGTLGSQYDDVDLLNYFYNFSDPSNLPQAAIVEFALSYDDAYSGTQGSVESLRGDYAEWLLEKGIVIEYVSLNDFNLTDWLGSTLGGFLSTDIIGTISFLDILLVVIGIGLLMLILKLFAGG